MSYPSSATTQKVSSKKICILPFLHGLLDDESKTDIICWTDKAAREFRFVEKHKVAQLWGATKPNRRLEVMTYSNMARVLRTFCKDGMLEKISGRSCRWRFVDSENSQQPLLFGIDRILSSDFGNGSFPPSPASSTTSGSPSSTPEII
ncbi:Protein CBG08837 [Caenorhabditis briggsae]|uniref:Protein CBG08837 n=3 Tax=Caenorhabditis briggsae TaxID=6238 RepID=A8X7I2_CAEBR|nr:Protein CBG08837 [Caenorhabditis briggsae]ULT86564.1 hypothetical protein L3Y34_006338 [Caenorhabditis briggsae]CAP28593.1 Protein CBG08837 [Caenorhabditis briggsae]